MPPLARALPCHVRCGGMVPHALWWDCSTPTRPPTFSVGWFCRKITDDEVAQLRARYAGNQADRNAAAAAPAASSSSAAASAGGKAGGKGAAKGGEGKAAKGGEGKAAGKAADGGKADGAAAGKGKKEKGDKAAAGGGKGGGSKEPERPADISRVDLRVG